MINKKAFTLAEVLITLVIIGVVAALTIPVLNNSQSDKALKSAAKKNAAAFQQALDMYNANNGAPFIENNANSMVLNLDTLMGYLKADKLAATDGIIAAINAGEYKMQDGTAFATEEDGNIPPANPANSYRLADGTDFCIFVGDNDETDGTMGVYVDVNGVNKGPNVLGKDLLIIPYTGTTNKMFFTEDALEEEAFELSYKALYE